MAIGDLRVMRVRCSIEGKEHFFSVRVDLSKFGPQCRAANRNKDKRSRLLHGAIVIEDEGEHLPAPTA